MEEALEESIIKEDVDEIVKRRISMAPLSGVRLTKNSIDPNLSSDNIRIQEEIKVINKPVRTYTNYDKFSTIVEGKEESEIILDLNESNFSQFYFQKF